MLESHSVKKISLIVDPGICGFACTIDVRKSDQETVSFIINNSACKHIQRFSEFLKELTLNELFAPFSANSVYISAGKARCHSSCPIPSAVLKAAEVAMGMALPREISIKFR